MGLESLHTLTPKKIATPPQSIGKSPSPMDCLGISNDVMQILVLIKPFPIWSETTPFHQCQPISTSRIVYNPTWSRLRIRVNSHVADDFDSNRLQGPKPTDHQQDDGPGRSAEATLRPFRGNAPPHALRYSMYPVCTSWYAELGVFLHEQASYHLATSPLAHYDAH